MWFGDGKFSVVSELTNLSYEKMFVLTRECSLLTFLSGVCWKAVALECILHVISSAHLQQTADVQKSHLWSFTGKSHKQTDKVLPNESQHLRLFCWVLLMLNVYCFLMLFRRRARAQASPSPTACPRMILSLGRVWICRRGRWSSGPAPGSSPPVPKAWSLRQVPTEQTQPLNHYYCSSQNKKCHHFLTLMWFLYVSGHWFPSPDVVLNEVMKFIVEF